ncbi:hypothetical protein KW419_16130 [Vibrio fluvialis]|nr:hypothetical protein [Vibrio fluvialis]
MPSTLNKPSDFYEKVVAELDQKVKGATVTEYALYGEHEVSGLECHVSVDEYGLLSQHQDGRIKQPVRMRVFCLVSRAVGEEYGRHADLVAQDLASAVGRIVFNNHFSLGGAVSKPSEIQSLRGLFRSGQNGYECWETEWWQTLHLGELPEEEPVLSGLYVAINPQHPEKKDEYQEWPHAELDRPDSAQ